jgi:hypothetical protein
VSRAVATALLREQAADPWRCWIRHAPVRWPGPETPWVDLATGTLGGSDGEPELLAALQGPRLADVFYLPPVPADLAAARDRLAAQHASRGTPVVVQLLPDDARPADAAATAELVVVWDLLAVVLAGEGASAITAPPAARPGDAAALPLLPGVAHAQRLDALAAALAAAGVTVLHGLPLELSGRDRRTLAESVGESISEASYLSFFHGETPSAAPLARMAARHGMLPLLPRPLPRPPLRGAGNLRAAGALAACGELCLLLGEPESRAQTLLRAARFAEREPYDLAAVSRDGNLAVLPWLEGEALEVAAEAAAGTEPALWRQLLARLAAS